MRGTLLAWGIVVAASLAGCARHPGEAADFDEVRRARREANAHTYGENTLLIRAGGLTASISLGSEPALTIEDADAIAKRCPAAAKVAPLVALRAQLACGERTWMPSSITGTTPALLDMRGWSRPAEGRALTDKDVANAAAICLVGQTVVREFLAGQPAVGQQIRINGRVLTVVGVLPEKGRDQMGQDHDDVVVMPWTTAVKLRKDGKAGELNAIRAQASSRQDVAIAAQQITAVLRERRHLKEGDADDFSVVDVVNRD